MTRATRAAAVGALAAALAGAGAATARADDELGARIDRAVQRATAGGFWGAVLVARGGDVVLAKGYGFADYGSTPNTPGTLFEIASVSKQFTAAAALTLVDDGRLALSDTLADVFGPAAVPPDERAITVEQLMTHTAGLGERAIVPYAWPGDRAALVEALLAPPLAARPGARFAYSNGGYALLAAVVEEVAGAPFEDYVREAVFAPAGLEATGFVGDADLAEGRTVSARLDPARPGATALDWHWGWGYRGMGGVVTTAEDLHRWDRALRGDAVLSPEARVELLRPRAAGYAGGWFVEATPRGTTRVHHGGGVAGYRANVVRYLEEDALVVVLTNDAGDLGAVTGAIEERLFPPPRLRAALDIGPYAAEASGAVRLPGRGRWRVEAAEDGVLLRLEDGRTDHVLARLELPPGPARGFADELRRARAARPAGAAGVAVGVYLGRYGDLDDGRLELTDDLELIAMPRYRGVEADGTEVVDERATVVLVDRARGGWPLMVHTGDAAAGALADSIEAALRE